MLSNSNIDEATRIEAAKREYAQLKRRIKEVSRLKTDGKMESINRSKLFANNVAPFNPLKQRRLLLGHFGKVYSCHWSGDNMHALSASQDGKLMLWNALTSNKVFSIPLRSSWVMTCAFEQIQNRLVACGGLDNICSIYQLGQQSIVKPVRELNGHIGYMSCCRFIDESRIITSSGDGTSVLWDVETSNLLSRFEGHDADVMSISIPSTNINLFASGSVDATVKLWDIRGNRCVHTYTNHTSDVNSVCFFPDGNAIGTGSEDFMCRVFDLRCWNEVVKLGDDQLMSTVQCGYDDYTCRAWDIANPSCTPAYLLQGHENRVSCLSLSPGGDVLCTGSWDSTLRIWA